ncbi:CFEM domain-containing protein [Colletotrichum asianum]
MRKSHLLAALAASARMVTGLGYSSYPNCAVICVMDALPRSPCRALDAACLCADTTFTDLVAPCIKANCTMAERLDSVRVSATACGVTVADNTALPRYLTGILFALPTVFISIRILNKILNPLPWGADDFMAITGYVSWPTMIFFGTLLMQTAQVCTIPLVPLIYRSLDIGLGDPVWTVAPTKMVEFLQMLFATQILYVVGLMTLKASVLFFFLRIFPARGFRKIIWATHGLNFLVGLIYIILTFAQCRPLSLYWTGWDKNESYKNERCLDFNKFILSHAIINIILDVWMLILPLTQLYKLNLVLRKKIGVMLMFSVGLFLTAVSAIRIHTMVRFMTDSNVTSQALWVYVWTFTELCVGVFVACMPNAGQLWRTLFIKPKPKAIGESKSRRHSAYGAEMVSLAEQSQKQRENSVASCSEGSENALPLSTHSPV